MEKDCIKDEERLYRAILNKIPNAIVNGRVMPSVFIQENTGTSVERDGDREHNEILETLKSRFNRNGKEDNYLGAASVTAKGCRVAKAYPSACGNRKNIFHAEIHESETEILLSLTKAMLISRMCALHLK